MLKKEKWFALVFIGMLAFGFSGCQKTEQEKPSQTTEENAEPKEEPKKEEETEIVIENKLLSKGDLKKIEADGEFLIMTPQQFAENYNFIAGLSEDIEGIKNFQIEKADGIKTYSYTFKNGIKLQLVQDEKNKKNQFSKIKFENYMPSESIDEQLKDYIVPIYTGYLSCIIEGKEDSAKVFGYMLITAQKEEKIGEYVKIRDDEAGYGYDVIYENEIMTFSISALEKPIEITDKFNITIEEFQKRYNERAEALDEEKIESSSIKEVGDTGFIQILLQDGSALTLESSDDKKGFKSISCTAEVDLDDMYGKFFTKSILLGHIFNPNSKADTSGAFTEVLVGENNFATVSDDVVTYVYRYNPDNHLATFMIMPKQ